MSDRFLTTSEWRRRIDQYEIEPDPPEPDEEEAPDWVVRCTGCGMLVAASASQGEEGEEYCPRCWKREREQQS